MPNKRKLNLNFIFEQVKYKYIKALHLGLMTCRAEMSAAKKALHLFI